MHEIHDTDTAMYSKKEAWHGLGTVIDHYPTIPEALTHSGLDWEVIQSDYLTASTLDAQQFIVDNYVANIRSDTGEVLGVVSKDYRPVQNRDLFDIAVKAAGYTARVETAGSLQGGRKVYLLLKTSSFAVGNDEIQPYFALFDGKDGSMGTIGTDTSVRVCCKNTLDAALSGKVSKISLRHRGNTIEDVYDQMVTAIKSFKQTGKIFREKVEFMATAKDWDSKRISLFFENVYTNIINTDIKKELAKKEPNHDKVDKLKIKASADIMKMQDKFIEESDMKLNVSTGWLAANAVTNFIQNRQGDRGKQTTQESRIHNNLIGNAATLSSKVMQSALKFTELYS